MRPWWVLAALCVGNSVSLLDTTVVNVAIPALVADLGATVTQILWVVSSYLVAYAVLLVTGGRLGDLYGARTVYIGGMALFTAASAACGLAATPGQLIAARLVQGLGAALLTPQVLAIVSRTFPAERRGAALGVWGAVAGASAAAGPTVGGLLVSAFGWRSVFYVNVPLGIIAVGLALALVPDTGARDRRRFDVLGTVLLTAALFLLAYGLIEGDAHDWGQVAGPVTVPMLLAAGVVVLGAFAAVEHRRQDREPLLPFAVLRDRNFRLAAILVCALPFSLNAMFFLTLLHLQTGLGLTASSAGLLVAVAPILSVAVSVYAGRLIDRFGGKYVMIAGYLAFAAGIAALAVAVRPGASWPGLLPGLLVFGVGMGLAAAPPAAIALHDIPPSLAGAASGLFNMSRLCGSALGGAAVGALLQVRLGDASIGASSPALVDAVRATYLLPVVVLVAATAAAFRLRPPAPAPAPAAPVPAPVPALSR
ncbi:DHA2 family efflux MFS transporter permease subunit [Spirilliplanes yamanashiensis]|uniref:DHA2 family efflux MFS transporter permease subunit n=1 Tax=Spirilliplanes yamanashiensis TaxID=42233 RepID=UPI002789C787|nr:DHA2 family efflux MFS transporter permease subunit [Spirilliplanes yamanashiensis]MDP9819298.1 EmrB/QacA subfamily drug resistance transporter [Spirilliplanes yamanashiensis]